MDKLDFDNGVAGPPTKRQKISTETPSIVPTTQPEIPTEMDHQKTHLTIVDNGFQPEREYQVGILCFVNNSNPGFSGTLKQRYVSGRHSSAPFVFELASFILWFPIMLSSPLIIGVIVEGYCSSRSGGCRQLFVPQLGTIRSDINLSSFPRQLYNKHLLTQI
jgi:hypothetical protein